VILLQKTLKNKISIINQTARVLNELENVHRKERQKMKKTDHYRMRLVLVSLIGALVLTGGSVNADYIVGAPANLGSIVNSSARDEEPGISSDGLSIYFCSLRSGGYGGYDMWVTTRASTYDDWSPPVNLGLPVNSSADDFSEDISANGLELYFGSNRTGSSGYDIWVAKRPTPQDDWRTPVNLGPMVNSSGAEGCPAISDDGLELYFWSTRSGSSGTYDIWVSKRSTKQDDWGQAVNLGTPVNSSSADLCSDVSPDGLSLILVSARAGGYGGSLGDLWLTKRSRINSPWGQPVNLGPIVNGPSSENGPCLSSDGLMLYFSSDRAGGSGLMDMWQVPLIPIVDFDSDGFVDANDMSIMVDHWGEAYSLCDIAPSPFGDGIVDIKDLTVLAGHLFEAFPPVESVEVDEADDGGQVELVLGQMLVVTLESNPTTGYCWELVEEQGSILKQMGKAEFIPSDTGEPPLVGAGGWEIFRFRAVSTGQMNLQLVYHRPWEGRVPPLQTFSLQAIVP